MSNSSLINSKLDSAAYSSKFYSRKICLVPCYSSSPHFLLRIKVFINSSADISLWLPGILLLAYIGLFLHRTRRVVFSSLTRSPNLCCSTFIFRKTFLMHGRSNSNDKIIRISEYFMHTYNSEFISLIKLCIWKTYARAHIHIFLYKFTNLKFPIKIFIDKVQFSSQLVLNKRA